MKASGGYFHRFFRRKGVADHLKKILESMEPAVSALHQFLDYMDEYHPQISSRKLFLGKDTCYELSHVLEEYRQYDKPNYTMDRYPLIHFLFRFSNAIQLLQYDAKGKYYAQGANAKQFKKLSIPAQYCIMITYMFTSFDHGFFEMLMSSKNKSSGMNLTTYDLIRENSIYVYFDFFQLIKGLEKGICRLSELDFRHEHMTKKKYSFTELGKRFKSLNEENLFLLNPYVPSNLEDDATYEVKQDRAVAMLLKEFCIEESQLPSFFQKPCNNAIYTLKVTLNEATWQFSAGSQATLEDLHIAIQYAARFDFDHPYYFMIDDIKYFHEACNEEQRFAYQYTLGELDLCKKKHFIYLFDFGDDWKFDIVVKDVMETETNSEIRLIEQKGKIPKQYDENEWL